MSSIAYDEWHAKGVELFGPDMEQWRFKCPTCGDVISLADAKANAVEAKGKGWAPGQECIGRHTDKRGCNWAAYGLFRGPLFVRREGDNDGGTPCFDFDGLPFTK